MSPIEQASLCSKCRLHFLSMLIVQSVRSAKSPYVRADECTNMLFLFKNKYHYTYPNTYIALYISYAKVTCNTHTHRNNEIGFHPSNARSLISLTTTPLFTPFHRESRLHPPKPVIPDSTYIVGQEGGKHVCVRVSIMIFIFK